MKKRDIFSYNRVIKPICGLLTNHRYRKLIGWDDSFSKDGYKNVHNHDFYYKCKICGWTYFNHTPRLEELEFIKERDKNEIQK